VVKYFCIFVTGLAGKPEGKKIALNLKRGEKRWRLE
jgi:hypothetical protein